jgi:hypothetical protein
MLPLVETKEQHISPVTAPKKTVMAVDFRVMTVLLGPESDKYNHEVKRVLILFKHLMSPTRLRIRLKKVYLQTFKYR